MLTIILLYFNYLGSENKALDTPTQKKLFQDPVCPTRPS